MGIQINGQTDTITATDGSLSIQGATTFTGDLTGNVTGNVTGNLTGTASTATAAATAYGLSGSPTLSGITSVSTTNLTVNGNSYPSSGPLSNRNKIINGDMRIDQRNAGASVTPTDAYTLDRWEIREDTDGAITAQQVSEAPAGFNKSLKITVTTADSSLAATQRLLVDQRIEGFNTADLDFGTAGAKTVTLSFWVRSSLTGTFGGSLINHTNNRSYPYTYSISAANTWEYKTVTIAGDTSGTWETTTSAGIKVYFGLGVGSTYSGTASAWAASEFYSTTGAVSVIGTLNATWQITGVQLEAGSVATPFEHRSYGDELARCQRYYETCYQQGLAPGSSTSQNNILAVCPGNINRGYGHLQFQVKKRASATVTFYSTSGAPGKFRNASQGTDITMSAACSFGDSGISYETSAGIVGVTDRLQGLYTAEAEL